MTKKWDSFTADVEQASGRKKPGCSVGAYLKTLDKAGRIQVEAAFGRDDLQTAAIGAALRNRGADFTDFTVGRHRRRICTCQTNGQ